MDPITSLVRKFSSRATARRAQIFRGRFVLGPETKILDLGSETGDNISRLLEGTRALPENVFIADIDAELVDAGARKYEFNPVVIRESGQLPFEDRFFDIVYCSSVIKHVTAPKSDVWKVRSGRDSKSHSLSRQKEFGNEIRRLGKQYFVQTPYKYFPIESHSWLPFVGWLPRRVLVPVLRFSNLLWVKKTSPDWYLLDKKVMRVLFHDAEIVEEKVFGITKSIMAVKSDALS
jgi:SAM-dependent methyltransferase